MFPGLSRKCTATVNKRFDSRRNASYFIVDVQELERDLHHNADFDEDKLSEAISLLPDGCKVKFHNFNTSDLSKFVELAIAKDFRYIDESRRIFPNGIWLGYFPSPYKLILRLGIESTGVEDFLAVARCVKRISIHLEQPMFRMLYFLEKLKGESVVCRDLWFSIDLLYTDDKLYTRFMMGMLFSKLRDITLNLTVVGFFLSRYDDLAALVAEFTPISCLLFITSGVNFTVIKKGDGAVIFGDSHVKITKWKRQYKLRLRLAKPSSHTPWGRLCTDLRKLLLELLLTVD